MIFLTSFFLLAASIDPKTALEIGIRVWQNECAATLDGLVSWNRDEEFASLGIGHFIWYPAKRGPYKETFPSLLSFLKSKNAAIPLWIEEARRCPWKTREEFLRAKSSKKMTELRDFLKSTVALQAEFLAERLDDALPLLENERKEILDSYRRVADNPNGIYALLDYVNFKGYGTSPKERYGDTGWGLLQVLDGMSSEGDPIEEFIRSAKQVLLKRVENAPAQRNEQQYLAGWFNRIETYKPKEAAKKGSTPSKKSPSPATGKSAK